MRLSTKALSSFSLLGATSFMLLPMPAIAEPTGYNQLSFQTEISSEVENDEVTASLYKKSQAQDAKNLANDLNTTLNHALAIAKRYPSVTVSTGQQNTYPRYDKNDKIIGWTGQANLNLKSSDFIATSQLISDLQHTMMMQNLSFSISDEKQKAVEKELMIQASNEFQAQARSLTNAWGATGYRVISVNLNTGNRYYPQPSMQMARIESMDAVAPKFEAGNSTVTVTANGTIELVD